MDLVETGPAEPVPMQLRNAPTRAMKAWGYGEGYQHAHENKDGIGRMPCLPERFQDRVFYTPTDRGIEQRIAQRLVEIRKTRRDSEG